MTTEDALSFLRRHQPLAPTSSLDEATLRKLDEVRIHFAENQDAQAIPLLLNVFGEGDGHGVYSMIESTIAKYPRSEIVPHIREALNSAHRSVRTWNAELACSFPDSSYLPFLKVMATSQEDDERDAALECLVAINS